MTDRELLRLHLEAVWSISLPALDGARVELPASGALPPWSLYHAQLAHDAVTLWRRDVADERRADLFGRAQRAGDTYDPALGMRREVVLRSPDALAAPQAALPTQPQATVRLLGAADASRLEAFEAESAEYFLDREHAPCIGVIAEERLVSVAHSSRRTTAACELGINTAPDARCRGYASAATIAWTQAIRQEGLLPIYSAFAYNAASLRLAAATGYTPRINGVYGPVGSEA
jgi:RimJ/RimL family protein N-acetyltransferase